ncbi:hypothetical protein LWP59_33935 [Amycolatopsis acidiphila]|nr:hypothetical protein [Amycolatopsis acidiphila]UIJ59022.1 hypothetical protein LWP59_33935 [Amycolatopsis acidiphila]GHG73409.1 hypothetical protein GCM10017788_36730 [Amycolatopsis acidiphila]
MNDLIHNDRELVPSAAMTRRALRAARPGVEEAMANGLVASAQITATSYVAAEAVRRTTHLANLMQQTAVEHPELTNIYAAYLGDFTLLARQSIAGTAVWE